MDKEGSGGISSAEGILEKYVYTNFVISFGSKSPTITSTALLGEKYDLYHD
jgi:hypothetical protein